MYLKSIFPLCLLSLRILLTIAQDLSRLHPSALYSFPDSYVLSELPLSALLRVKKSVNDIICTGFIKHQQIDSCPAAYDNNNSQNVNKTKLFNKNQSEFKYLQEEPASSRSFSDIKNFFLGSGDHQSSSSDELPDNRKTYHEHGLWKSSEESGKIQKLFQFSVTALAFLAFGGYLLCMIVQAIKSKGTYYYHPYAPVYPSTLKKKKPIFSYGKRRKRSSPPNDGYLAENQIELDMMYNGLISAIGVYVNYSSPSSPSS